jgi:hypothetical protein
VTLLIERKDQPAVEEIVVLFPEARMAQRRRWLRRGLIVFSVSTVVLLVATFIGGTGRRSIPPAAPSSASTQSSVTPLPLGTVINASSVVAIQMFSASHGVAIATFGTRASRR